MAREIAGPARRRDRKSTRLNSSHTEIYTLSLHDALPIYCGQCPASGMTASVPRPAAAAIRSDGARNCWSCSPTRSEEHTSELQSHRDLHSFPTRRSSDLLRAVPGVGNDRQRAAARRGGHPLRWREKLLVLLAD